MAKVEMDLAELRQLEKKIEDLEKEKQVLIDNQQQVIVHHKYFDGKIKVGSGAKDMKVNITGIKTINQFNHWSLESQRSIEHFNKDVSFNELVDKKYLEFDVTLNDSKSSKEYKNLSEVISEIKKEEEEKLKFELSNLRTRAIEAEVRFETSLEDSRKEIIRIRKTCDEKVESLQKDFTEKLNSLQECHKKEIFDKNLELVAINEEFNSFKENKTRLTLEEQLNNLTKELTDLKNRGFWKRIFNK